MDINYTGNRNLLTEEQNRKIKNTVQKEAEAMGTVDLAQIDIINEISITYLFFKKANKGGRL